jgi:hypothetical protein
MRAAIYAKALAGKSVATQECDLRRLCRQRGWTVAEVFLDPTGRPPRLSSGKGRLALLDALLDRRHRIGVLCLWRLGMLGHAIDDVLWALAEMHVRRGIHVVAPGDTLDTTKDDSLKKALKALARV